MLRFYVFIFVFVFYLKHEKFEEGIELSAVWNVDASRFLWMRKKVTTIFRMRTVIMLQYLHLRLQLHLLLLRVLIIKMEEETKTVVLLIDT